MTRNAKVKWLVGLMCLTLRVASGAVAPDAIYAEAVVAYHGHRWDDAIHLIDEGLKESPQQVALLELKGLVYKSAKEYPKAYDAFHELLELSLRGQSNGRRKSAYQFELGLIEFQLKQYGQARIFLQRALADNFNANAAHYFLGLIDLQTKAYVPAKEHFIRVASSNVEELKIPSQLYLGQIYAEENASQPALKSFFAAREGARRLAASTSPDARLLAQQVMAGADQSLKGASAGGFYGRAGLATEYDSNVLLAPSLSSGNTGGVTSAGTIKEVLQAGVGFTSSPLERVQWSPSFRTSYNYNSNAATRAGQFLNNDLALYVNVDPLERLSWGAKAETLLFFRNGDTGTSSGSFTAFSLLGAVGPYVHYDVDAAVTVGAELNVQPQKYFTDSTSDADFAKSGVGVASRAFIARDNHAGAVNPSAAVGVELQNTSGPEFRSRAMLAELANVVYFSKYTRLIPSLSSGIYFYNDRSAGARRDFQFSAGATVGHSLMAQMDLTATIVYTSNKSTVDDLYTYSRFVTSLGASYSF